MLRRMWGDARRSQGMSTKRGRIDGSFGAREVRHDKQIRIRDEVFDQLRRQITRGVQGDPVLLIHVRG